ncbi:uncharacterized protein LOC116850394 [Odontomachus brunneus]|uniref:uncharacterized protein LOC116850394 n=1 Tax=Odontomachus brunneus TaxID=486640 RepID=UPI0013F2A897|nr:uncharacterized protein LOC116850394 [Odontomachus brunneus]
MASPSCFAVAAGGARTHCGVTFVTVAGVFESSERPSAAGYFSSLVAKLRRVDGCMSDVRSVNGAPLRLFIANNCGQKSQWVQLDTAAGEVGRDAKKNR